MMRTNETIECLQKDIVIPTVVQQKADLAFAQIRNEHVNTYRESGGKIRRKAAWVSIAAATLMLGTMSVFAAAYFPWEQGMTEQLHATEAQKQFLVETQIANPVGIVTTENDITITALHTITDGRFARLSFKVEGYELEEGIEPSFEQVVVTFDDPHLHNWSGLGMHFFDGFSLDSRHSFTYVDGTPIKKRSDGSLVPRYIADDGSMEYDMLLMTDADSFIGKAIHVEFHNLGIYDSTEHQFIPSIEGTWTFDFSLDGSDQTTFYEMSEVLEGSGATVTHAEISPISLSVTYEMPRQMIETEVVEENGEISKITTTAGAPRIIGVRLKDGTLLTEITSGGGEGYCGFLTDTYQSSFATDHIIDPEQVDALLFIKSYPEGNEPFTEENLYIVPLP